MPQEIKGLRPVSEWIRICEIRGGAFSKVLEKIYGETGPAIEASARACRQTLALFAEAYGRERDVILVRSTGRINLLGMHIDHRGGSVNPIAIKELFMVASPRKDDNVQVRNVEKSTFPDENFRIRDCLPKHKIVNWDSWCHDALEKRRDDPSVTWSNYVRAPILYLQHLKTGSDGSFEPPLRGMDTMIYGRVPRSAGLSSSSSVVVAAAEACLRLNRMSLEPMEFIDLCGYGEWYVGTRGGAGDHAAIKFSKPNAASHITSFPLAVRSSPFPSGYRIVLANSLVEANKREGARNIFNSRVASYVFGFLLVQKEFPHYSAKIEHLRDLTPENLGVDDAEIYRLLKSLPQIATRQTLRDLLPHRSEEIEHVFRSHAEPPEGYKIRQVCTYGISECIRSEMSSTRLQENDVEGFGELLNISHDGDRVTRMIGNVRHPLQKDYSDDALDALLHDVTSSDETRRERARLWRQPGGYDVSVPELDTLVDIALAAPGVVGARLVGAGLGGSILAIVREDETERLLHQLEQEYYAPRHLAVSAEVVKPVGGAGVLEVG
jgi:N-acetylgalactosamine kinase